MAKVKECAHCGKRFVRVKRFEAHVRTCEKQQGLAQRPALRPAAVIAADTVHSAESVRIGVGNSCKGQDNRELFFPKKLHMFPLPSPAVQTKQGWAMKGVAGHRAQEKKNPVQKAFFISIFENKSNPVTKIKQYEAHKLMKLHFCERGGHELSGRKVLSPAQIMSWMSQESCRR